MSPTKPRCALFLALALLPLAIAACGGGGPSDPTPEQQQAIESRFSDYRQALVADDAKAVCADISPALVSDAGGEKACEKSAASYMKDSKALIAATKDIPIDRIEIAADGSIARLYVEGSDTQLRFVPSGSDWYVLPPPTLLAEPGTTTSAG